MLLVDLFHLCSSSVQDAESAPELPDSLFFQVPVRGYPPRGRFHSPPAIPNGKGLPSAPNRPPARPSAYRAREQSLIPTERPTVAPRTEECLWMYCVPFNSWWQGYGAFNPVSKWTSTGSTGVRREDAHRDQPGLVDHGRSWSRLEGVHPDHPIPIQPGLSAAREPIASGACVRGASQCPIVSSPMMCIEVVAALEVNWAV